MVTKSSNLNLQIYKTANEPKDNSVSLQSVASVPFNTRFYC